MGSIEKIISVAMLPLGVLIILERFDVFSISLPVNKIILGAALMIVLQLVTTISIHGHNGKPSVMSNVTRGIFMIIAIAAIIFQVTGKFTSEVPLILGIMMIVEALYALH